jgi:hypothetical protein
MPKVSKESAAHVEHHGPVEDRHEDIGGYTVTFASFGVDIDGTPLLRGLPGDACTCPHCSGTREEQGGGRQPGAV